jgi:ferric-dicitrate binding protein FerR (iron transport regulator)
MTPEESYAFQEFLDRLDLYGGRLESWPHEARAAAETMLAKSPEAQAQLDAMRRVETALQQSQTIRSDGIDAFAARAMRAAQDRPRQTVVRRLPWAVAGVVALVAGLYVGQLPGSAGEGPSDIVTAALDQSGGHDVW